MNDRKLTTGFYRPTESFKSIPEHVAVCFEDDLTLVAIVGASDDDTDHVLESHQYAQLFAAAPETLQKLSHALAKNAELTESNSRLQATYDHVEEINLRYAEHIQHLTAFNESMQTDARKNTETIKKLKQALTDIRATTVMLGDSQGGWKAWRECCEIAGEALK